MNDKEITDQGIKQSFHGIMIKVYTQVQIYLSDVLN